MTTMTFIWLCFLTLCVGYISRRFHLERKRTDNDNEKSNDNFKIINDNLKIINDNLKIINDNFKNLREALLVLGRSVTKNETESTVNKLNINKLEKEFKSLLDHLELDVANDGAKLVLKNRDGENICCKKRGRPRCSTK